MVQERTLAAESIKRKHSLLHSRPHPSHLLDVITDYIDTDEDEDEEEE